eukprot:CAMPEP_0170144964 /NCGR_PEP_ID=MMETSP0033_2-20121228/16263_1 /TAXON_ID=195969 /ORGANISM="Dolichomastix tenuilepis, Strain CCMP3274" /LENGTH=186 /DNA_ID=CAMNT_0010381495 /DNA_START=104 /DNA_END=666 /DNA_ORIENTATION=-
MASTARKPRAGGSDRRLAHVDEREVVHVRHACEDVEHRLVARVDNDLRDAEIVRELEVVAAAPKVLHRRGLLERHAHPHDAVCVREVLFHQIVERFVDEILLSVVVEHDFAAKHPRAPILAAAWLESGPPRNAAASSSSTASMRLHTSHTTSRMHPCISTLKPSGADTPFQTVRPGKRCIPSTFIV